MTGPSSRTETIALLSAVVLLAGAASATVVTASPDCTERDANTSVDHGPPEECTDADSQGATVNGVDATTFWKLWSGDADSVEPDLEDRDPAERTELDRVRGLAPSVDFYFEQPPAATGRWNEHDHGDFSPGGTGSVTYPERADTKTTGITHGTVYDAHVTMFSVDPSTVVHRAGSETRFVRPSGSVRAVADFRAESDTGSGRCADSYSITSTDTTVRLVVDGAVVDSTDSKTATLDYSGLDGSHTFELETEYDVTVEHVDKWYHSHDDGGHCHSSTHYDTSTVTVDSETADVTVHEPPSAEARQYIYNDSDRTGVLLDYEGEWTTVELGELTVHSGWRFYTESRSGFGQMYTDDGSGPTAGDSSVRPLETHAYTVNDTSVSVADDEIPSGSLLVGRTERTTQAGTTGLPPRVDHESEAPHGAVRSMTVESTRENWLNVQNAGGRFDSWYSQFPFLSPPTPDYRVTGLVHGTSASVSPPPVEDVYAVDVSVQEESVDDGTYEYVVSVSDSAGTPIDQGQLVMGGKTFDVSDGTVTATLDDAGVRVNPRYEPPEWSGDGPYYQEADTIVPRGGGAIPSPFELFAFGVMMLAWGIPFALLMIAMDYAFGTRFFRDSLPSVQAVFQGIHDAIWRGRR